MQQELLRFFAESIRQSCERRQMSLSPSTQEYLVSVLEKYVSADSLLVEFEQNGEMVRGFEPLTSKIQRASLLPEELKTIGEDCLFFVGVFYGFVRKDGEAHVGYYCDIGSNAYIRYSATRRGKDSALFREVAGKFPDIGRILGDTRLEGLTEEQLYNLVVLYDQTKDQRYADLLRAKGIFVGNKLDS